MASKVVEVRAVKKSFQATQVLHGISFEVFKGECFAILGEKNSGKSTLFKIISGSSPFEQGELFILDLDAKIQMEKIKPKIGIISQNNSLDRDFSTLDNLVLYARYFGVDSGTALQKALQLLRTHKLDEYRDQNIANLSEGLQRRISFARALMMDPELIFIDEPTRGLDDYSSHLIWSLIEELHKSGKTILMTTDRIDEVEKLATRVLLIESGRMLCSGRPQQLISEYVGQEVIEFNCTPDEMSYYVARFKNEVDIQVLNEKLRLFVGAKQEAKGIMQRIETRQMSLRKGSLDDVYLKFTGQELVRAKELQK